MNEEVELPKDLAARSMKIRALASEKRLKNIDRSLQAGRRFRLDLQDSLLVHRRARE